MKIRKATKKDIKPMGMLMLEEFSKKPYNEKAKLPAVMKSLTFYLTIGKAYVAVDKEILGVIVFKKEQYWDGPVIIVEDLAVKEGYKGRGIGKMLLQKVESDKNAIYIEFNTNKQAKAVRFYSKLGYKTKTNTILMSKKL